MAAAVPTRADWQSQYRRRLAVSDTVIVLIAVLLAQLVRFGADSASLFVPAISGTSFTLGYTFVSLIFASAWLIGLRVYGTRDPKSIGTGTQEYRAIADASIRTFGVLTIGAFLLQLEIARAYLLLALPLGLLLLATSRWLWRGWLSSQRSRGRFLTRVVVVGEHSKSLHIVREIGRDHTTGFELVGALTERGAGMLTARVPVLSGLDEMLPVLEAAKADAVVYSGSDLISPQRLREFGWELQARGIDLIVGAALTDIAGPRIHARPVAGLSLIHVDYPQFTGVRYSTKRAFDIVVAGLALVLLSPVMLATALSVQSDGGPVLFRQERIGLDGRRFRLLKFRSMVPDAEQRLADLLPLTDGNGMLFKMHNDPRVTPLGRFLRRFSVDELPQLWNVLRGDMSLVGPRPPLLSEVENYEQWAARRLLVKPGITGLWQVSGRSDLSWDDSVRLDLYYVENWSLTGDLVILWRTIRAVMRPHGAY